MDKESIVIKDINVNLINRLKNYDIVLVKMTNEDISRGVSEKHQKRPFLIVKKNDKKSMAHGYYLTSNVAKGGFYKDRHKGFKVILHTDDYKLRRNSLLLFFTEIKLPYENIMEYIDHINESDLSKLKKYRALLTNQKVISDKNNKVIEIGDIIIDDNNNYLIYQVDNTNCYGYLIKKSNCKVDILENRNFIFFRNQLYFINFGKSKKFNIDDTLCIVDRFNGDIVNLVRRNKKIIKSKSKKKKR